MVIPAAARQPCQTDCLHAALHILQSPACMEYELAKTTAGLHTMQSPSQIRQACIKLQLQTASHVLSVQDDHRPAKERSKAIHCVCVIPAVAVIGVNLLVIDIIAITSIFTMVYDRKWRTHLTESGTKGTGSAPLMMRMDVPTSVLNAFLNLLLPTLGLPKVMHRTSASGYSIAAQAAPVQGIRQH